MIDDFVQQIGGVVVVGEIADLITGSWGDAYLVSLRTEGDLGE
jgi:hypothetical protein